MLTAKYYTIYLTQLNTVQPTITLCILSYKINCIMYIYFILYNKTISELMHLNGVSVTFLPLDSLSKLPEKQKYFHFFNSIYCAARYSSNVPYSFQNIDYHTSVFIKTYYHCELHDLE